METKRVRDRLRRKHPRSEEMLGNVQRWAAPAETHGASPIGDDVGSPEREMQDRRDQDKIEV